MVPNFITKALQNEPITIYGDGTQTRSICHASDIVEGLVRAMEYDNTCGDVINLGNPEEHSVLEYADLIRKLVNTTSDLVFAEGWVGDDPQRRRPDISKARSLLDWEPKVGLHEGLRQTISYFKKELHCSQPADGLSSARVAQMEAGWVPSRSR